MWASQGSDFADIIESAFMDFEPVLQVLVSVNWFAAQLCRRKEFKIASLASRQIWRLAHVFKN
jgi:hypothetical protein